MQSQVEQARNRSTDEIPSVESFIVLRRRTIGGPIVEGLWSDYAELAQTDIFLTR